MLYFSNSNNLQSVFIDSNSELIFDRTVHYTCEVRYITD